MSHGDLMSQDANGEPLLVLCTVKDVDGKPVSGVKVDIWETDSSGHYDVQHPDRTGPDGRCVMKTDDEGIFWFKAIVPVPYPIPHDGPVGKLLIHLKRHPMRPAHMHFMFEKEGFDHLITYVFLFLFYLVHPSPFFRLALLLSFVFAISTSLTWVSVSSTSNRALYLKNDPYESSDAVFGVKNSLIVELGKVDKATADKYGVKEGSALMTYDFVLVTEKNSFDLRCENSAKALERLGRRVKIVKGLPVPELD